MSTDFAPNELFVVVTSGATVSRLWIRTVPDEGELHETWWKKQGLWAIDTANTNAWSTAADTILPRSGADALLLQESRRVLTAEDMGPITRRGRALGW